jgi:hypothetical protein
MPDRFTPAHAERMSRAIAEINRTLATFHLQKSGADPDLLSAAERRHLAEALLEAAWEAACGMTDSRTTADAITLLARRTAL